jgi:thiol-disulfide isomerase/thioredoxin
MNGWKTPLALVGLMLLAAVGGFTTYRLYKSYHPDQPPVQTLLDQQASTGQPAEHPAFKLPDPANKLHSLADLRGHPVLVNFWATWCPPCREEIPLLEKLQKRYASTGLKIVGIADDDPAKVKAYVGKMPIGYQILIAADGADKIARTMGLQLIGLPASVMIDANGNVVKYHMGELRPSEADAFIHSALKPAAQTKLAKSR